MITLYKVDLILSFHQLILFNSFFCSCIWTTSWYKRKSAAVFQTKIETGTQFLHGHPGKETHQKLINQRYDKKDFWRAAVNLMKTQKTFWRKWIEMKFTNIEFLMIWSLNVHIFNNDALEVLFHLSLKSIKILNKDKINTKLPITIYLFRVLICFFTDRGF